MSRRKYPNNAALGAQLRAFRMAAGLTQREVARRVKVSPNTITHWEGGHRCPMILDLDAYLRVVGASITLGAPS